VTTSAQQHVLAAMSSGRRAFMAFTWGRGFCRAILTKPAPNQWDVDRIHHATWAALVRDGLVELLPSQGRHAVTHWYGITAAGRAAIADSRQLGFIA